jgi:hypothetical protein
MRINSTCAADQFAVFAIGGWDLMQKSIRHLCICTATFALGLEISLAAQEAAKPQPQARGEAQEMIKSTAPGDLVARVVKNELKTREGGHFMYRDWKKTVEGSKTREVVETSAGTVAKLIALNDQPLSPEQRIEEEARLRNLQQHPELQEHKKKEQEQDARRTEKMFGELPKAFLYVYDGIEAGATGEIIRLKFSPNPNYEPPSHEMAVYKGMSGQLWLEVTHCRLARIQATLFREVTFGWGVLGHLDKGGHFDVQQSKIGPDRWEVTSMDVQFAGKALLFKTINLHEVDKLSEFRPVPGGLTLAQGIALLEHSENQLASNHEGE